MTYSQSRSNENGTVSYIETDINCPFCLADVKNSLAALPDVEVAVDSSAGCFEVTHHTDEATLLEVIARSGHRLVEADNGEIVQGLVAAVSVASSCFHDQIGRSGEE